MIKIKQGNLLNADVEIIAHQVNCQGAYGAGIAKQISEKFPQAKKDYMKVCNNANKPKDLLGYIHLTKVEKFFIAGLFGQEYYGKYGSFYQKYNRQTDYDALKKALIQLHDLFPNKTIGLPYRMGCGLAGGLWETVFGIIEEVFNDGEVILYKLL
jgi:O-acetyl-ADP-ribose deacetylase (regulator of RNase III)